MPTIPSPILSRRALLAGFGLAGAGLISGCGGRAQDGSGTGSAGSSVVDVRMGTMATEDFLPGWVAERDGLFGAAARVSVQTFQSAQELSAALTAGEIDLAMTDPQVSASLTAGGTEMRLLWIALGATPTQGRFGIQVGPDSDVRSLADLRGRSIGVGTNTVPEYVMDRLLEEAGLTEGDVERQEIKKLPVRFQMMTSGQVDAAALPASLLALGEAQGCVTIADDTRGENLSLSVIAVRTEFLAGLDDDALDAVRQGWDDAAAAVNADPEAYRELLMEKAGLAETLRESYPVPEYPVDARPTEVMVQPQLNWMLEKGYLKAALAFHEESGSFVEG